ncbi:MAG: TonB-dependent receptor [Alistipes sp.]
MVRKLVLSLIAVMGVCALAFAQNKQISGTVVDTDGLPIIGATVMVDGTTVGTSTGADGGFSLPVPTNGSLLISFIGYQSQTISVSGRTHVEVTLKSDETTIDNVVVVGYGTGSKVGTSIGSSVKVKGEQLENKPVANVTDALQGKVAGLQVYTSSGEPTETSSMRLHGVGSLTAGSTPLFVLDGVPINSEAMLSLNSNDIESMTMLKDASATSIYGSRAANGVLYITMKKGRRGEQAKVVVNAQYGVSQPATGKYNVMNTNELAAYELENGLITESMFEDAIASGIDTNWRKYFYRNNAPTYQADLSVTGGTENTSYYIAGGYMNQDGTAPGSSMSKYTFRTNVDATIAPWMRMGSSVALGYDERSSASTVPNGASNAAFISLLTRPDTSPYNPDGSDIEKLNNSNYNPIYVAEKRPTMGRKMQVNANAYVMITPVKGLNIKSMVGLDGYWFTSKASQLASFASSIGNGSVSRSHQDSQTVSITNTIDYNFNFANPDHKLYLLAGHEGLKSNETVFTAARRGQIRDDLMMIATGLGTPTASDAYSSYLINSWFGRAEYSYQGRYTADATVRRDASSRFGVDNRSAVFYSLGFMWNAKREAFLANNKTISDLSFKVSYGTQGNSSISNYGHQNLISFATYNDQAALYLSQYGNEDLGWEKQELLTVAASIGLWDRLNVELEFYNRLTKDMLMNVPMPSTSGYMSRYENVGSMRNRGIDITLNAAIVRTQDWNVNFNATFSYGKSIITKLFNGYTEYAMPDFMLCYTVGHDAGEFYMPVFVGVDPTDGKQMWETIDKTTGEKSQTKNFENATAQLVNKSQFAPYSGGFGVNAGWKGIMLSADFSFNYGKYLCNNANYFLESASFAGSYNRSTELKNQWRQPGDITNVPKFGEEIQFDSHLLEDASFLRLKNLTIGYDFPKTWMAKTGVISGIRVYFTARNLLTFTGYSGYDPEVDKNVSLGDYPNSRQFVGGIQITF